MLLPAMRKDSSIKDMKWEKVLQWSYTCMLSSTSVLNSPLFSPSPAPSIFSPWPFGEELNWWWFLFSLVDLFEKSAGILCKELIEHASF